MRYIIQIYSPVVSKGRSAEVHRGPRHPREAMKSQAVLCVEATVGKGRMA
jgi:hypothetical protein